MSGKFQIAKRLFLSIMYSDLIFLHLLSYAVQNIVSEANVIRPVGLIVGGTVRYDGPLFRFA